MKKTVTLCTFIFIFVVASTSFGAFGGNTTNDSFSRSKRILLKEVYFDHMVSFYCGNPFTKDKKVIPSDTYMPKRNNKRAQRIEWEHVVPAHAFGQSFPPWREGDGACVNRKGKSFKGRNCARKVSEAFRFMEADLYNLVPAIGELNGLRSNYSYAIIPGEERAFGNCDFEVRNRKAEPAPEIRGDIARIYMYMDHEYPGCGIISKKNRKLFEAWSKADPVDEWECERNLRIQAIQGNVNPFVNGRCVP